MNKKNIVFTTLFIVVLTVVGSFSSDAQSILGREISFRKYVRINNRRSREEVIREAVKSSAFLYLTIKDGDFQGKAMMSNDALIGYYDNWMPDSLLQENPSYDDWATNIILNEIPLDVTGFYREYHKVDSLVNWKGPKYKLLEKCIELCDNDIIDYNILATLFQWNIVLDNVDEELHLYFFPLEFRQYGSEP